MNTIYLKYALEVERVGSITMAAQNLFMAQPNLSKALKDLEKELGFLIFQRTASGVKVTEEGEEFLYFARQITEQLSAIERITQRTGGQNLRYKISIPRGSYIANGFTAFVSTLKIESGMEITINETNSLGTIANVADRGYNVGIIRYQMLEEEYFMACLQNNHLNYEIIWEFEYVLVMSKEHPLAQHEKITIEELRKYTRITHGDIEIQQLKNLVVPSKGVEKIINVYERGSQFDLLANVPTTYMWVSPIPRNMLEKNNLVQHICKIPNNRYKDVMIFRKDYHLNDYDKLFQKKLYESKVDVSHMQYK